jgi:hypothetical protein
MKDKDMEVDERVIRYQRLPPLFICIYPKYIDNKESPRISDFTVHNQIKDRLVELGYFYKEGELQGRSFSISTDNYSQIYGHPTGILTNEIEHTIVDVFTTNFADIVKNGITTHEMNIEHLRPSRKARITPKLSAKIDNKEILTPAELDSIRNTHAGGNE